MGGDSHVALTRPVVGMLRRGRSVVDVVQISSASRLPIRKVGIRSIEGASAQPRLAPNRRGRQGCLARSQSRSFRRSRRAWDEVEAQLEQLRATWKRQSTMRARCRLSQPTGAEGRRHWACPAVAPLVSVQSHRGEKPRCSRGGLLGRELPATSRKLTERGNAMRCRKRRVGRTSDEIGR